MDCCFFYVLKYLGDEFICENESDNIVSDSYYCYCVLFGIVF